MNKIQDMKNVIEVKISKELVQIFYSNTIHDEFLKKLISIIKNKSNPILFLCHKHRTLEILMRVNIQLEYIIDDFNIQDIYRIENSLEPSDIIEKAAIGFLLSYFLKKNKIRHFTVYKKRGKGYDYFWVQDNDTQISLECTGCNKISKNTFHSRISEKKKKFEPKEWDFLSDIKYIGVVDFYHNRYIIWRVKQNV